MSCFIVYLKGNFMLFVICTQYFFSKCYSLLKNTVAFYHPVSLLKSSLSSSLFSFACFACLTNETSLINLKQLVYQVIRRNSLAADLLTYLWLSLVTTKSFINFSPIWVDNFFTSFYFFLSLRNKDNNIMDDIYQCEST